MNVSLLMDTLCTNRAYKDVYEVADFNEEVSHCFLGGVSESLWVPGIYI
jgi:hypothetical protein